MSGRKFLTTRANQEAAAKVYEAAKRKVEEFEGETRVDPTLTLKQAKRVIAFFEGEVETLRRERAVAQAEAARQAKQIDGVRALARELDGEDEAGPFWAERIRQVLHEDVS